MLFCSGAAGQDPNTRCASKSKDIVRFDDHSRRAFVVADVRQLQNRTNASQLLKHLQDAIGVCKPDWDGSWSVSFFSNAKYAGYKDEASLATYVADGSWEAAYIAEYDRSAGQLTLYPLSSKQVKRMQVSPKS